jgi:nicotinamidase-related amidase
MSIQINNSDLAVLLIDMQQSFIKDVSVPERKKLIKTHIDIIRYCNEQNIPLIHVEYAGQGKTVPQIRKVLNETNTIYISKSAPDVFSENGLGDIIRKELNRNTLFLMGLYASECVYSSGWGAKELGFEVITSNDVIADHADTTYYTSIKRNSSLETFYKEKDIKFYQTYKEFFNTLKN